MSAKLILTPLAVKEIFNACLFKNGDSIRKMVRVEAILRGTVSFNADRLEANRKKIMELLGELPPAFREASGGWSFLRAHEDKYDRQWAAVGLRVEQLFLLGIGIGRARYTYPRGRWHELLGGAPYFTINVE